VVTEILLLGAALITVTSAVQAVSVRFSLPQTFVVSFVGMLFGALFIGMRTWLPGRTVMFIDPIITWPLPAETCLTLFLPPLLFQASLRVEIRDMLADCVPILILAVPGVFIATGTTALAASWISSIPLKDSLLLGAIVATTDASAVLAIFRNVTAPGRLVRLVEGESLLNDAAAISIVTVLATASQAPHTTVHALADVARIFALSFLGGALFGFLSGRALVWALAYLGGEGKAELTLTLAAPYPLYVIGNGYFHVSGIVTVVMAGLVISGLGRTRLSPRNWSHLQLLWEQAAGIAGILVFLLATVRVPALLQFARTSDLLALVAIVAAALLARIAVLFGFFPFMARLRLSDSVSPAYRLAIAWGGLRGAVTIVLALGVAGDASLPDSTRRSVTVLATAFVLFTLIVNGTTIKPLIRRLGLDRLSNQDKALQSQVVDIANAEVVQFIQVSAERCEIDADVVRTVVDRYRLTFPMDTLMPGSDKRMSCRDRLAAGLLALARKERDLIPRYGSGVIGTTNLDRMIANAAAMTEAVRRDGRTGYRRAAAKILHAPWNYRLALWVHRYLGISAPFAHALETRFELLICRRAVLDQLQRYNEDRLNELLGRRLSNVLGRTLLTRIERTQREINDMRERFGRYTRKLEKRMLLLAALNAGRESIEGAYQDLAISKEIYNSLDRNFNRAWRTAVAHPSFSRDDD
jgi:CPA1 family monovalent cation:H+ antiporter